MFKPALLPEITFPKKEGGKQMHEILEIELLNKYCTYEQIETWYWKV